MATHIRTSELPKITDSYKQSLLELSWKTQEEVKEDRAFMSEALLLLSVELVHLLTIGI